MKNCWLPIETQKPARSIQINNQPWFLISNCPAVVPVIAGSEAVAGLRTDRNTLRIAPVGRPPAFVQAKLHVVSLLLQSLHGVRREPLLNVQHVGQPLIM